MAAKTQYIVRHANGEDVETVTKGGKVPTFATWAFFPAKNEWVRLGWSFQATLADAQKKALPEYKANGARVMVTRVLPCQP
ncbi:MAG TPA: hypothetical protein VLG91_24105 [Streptomyces sp.]|nr:hypothetical protein [Streptomyces sp.]